MREFKPLEMREQFKRELNPVYVHVGDSPSGKRCGHAFSPGEPWIIEAYLAGDLVPKTLLESAQIEIAFLRVQLEEMRAASLKVVTTDDDDNLDDEERREPAA